MKIKKSQLQKIIQEELMEALRVVEAIGGYDQAAMAGQQSGISSTSRRRDGSFSDMAMGTSTPTGTYAPQTYGGDRSTDGTVQPPTADEQAQNLIAAGKKAIGAATPAAATAADCLRALHKVVTDIIKNDPKTKAALEPWLSMTKMVPLLDNLPGYINAITKAKVAYYWWNLAPKFRRRDGKKIPKGPEAEAAQEKAIKAEEELKVAKANIPGLGSTITIEAGDMSTLAALKSPDRDTFIAGWLKPLYDSLATLWRATHLKETGNLFRPEFTEGQAIGLFDYMMSYRPYHNTKRDIQRSFRISPRDTPYNIGTIFAEDPWEPKGNPAATLHKLITEYEKSQARSTAGTGNAPVRPAGGHEDVGFGPIPTQEQLTRMVAEELHKLMIERNKQ